MPTRRSSGGGSASSSDDEAAPMSPRRRPSLKRKPSSDEPDEAAAGAARRVQSESPPASASVLHHPPHDRSDSSDDDDEAAAAEFARVFPNIQPRFAASLWAGFVRNARACIKHYNTKCQADFVYKHAPEYGIFFLGEPDGSHYYHLNFYAKDKKGQSQSSQLFFGEIRVCVAPEEEDVTCCCPSFTF